MCTCSISFCSPCPLPDASSPRDRPFFSLSLSLPLSSVSFRLPPVRTRQTFFSFFRMCVLVEVATVNSMCDILWTLSGADTYFYGLEMHICGQCTFLWKWCTYMLPVATQAQLGDHFFLLPVGLSGTTVLRPQLRLLQGRPCHSLTLRGVWGWICAPNWPKVGEAAPGFEPRTSCMRVRSASHYTTGAAPLGAHIVIKTMYRVY